MFGAVFVFVNSAGLPDPWPLVIRATGLLVATLLIAALVLVARRAPPGRRAPVSGFVDHRFWIIVAGEAGALFGGLFVINGVVHRGAVSVAWTALGSACTSAGSSGSGRLVSLTEPDVTLRSYARRIPLESAGGFPHRSADRRTIADTAAGLRL